MAKTVFKGGAFFISKDGFRVKLYHKNDLPNIHKSFHYRGTDSQWTIRGHVLDVKFNKANPPELISSAFEDEASWYENYFLGSDESRWKSEIYPVRKIRLRNVYPGIDFVAYTIGENVEYDWIVQPGANPSLIEMKITGDQGIEINEGNLEVKTSVGNFTMKAPRAWQSQKPIPCFFDQSQDVVGFKIGSNYNSSQPLIIDPVLVFSTYSGSRGDNFGFTATYDTGGSLYAGGIIDIAQGAYPVTTGSFQTVYGGRGPAVAPVWLPCDASISKYKPDGSALLFATYLGGKSNEYPHSLGLDEKNNLLVFGTTLSSDFPIPKATAYDSAINAKHDIFVVKLSSDGKKMLAGTFLGGPQDDGINSGLLHFNYADDFRGDIISDVAGNIYISTCTSSPGFPVTLSAAQTVHKGGLESVVLSLNPNMSELRWSTFLGGTGDDAAYSIKMDDSMNIIVGGGTSSSNFPIAGNSLITTYMGGRADGYIAKLTHDSGKLIQSTFWGTGGYDQIYFVDLDVKNKIYATGQTDGNIPRTAGTYGKTNTTQFVIRLDNDLENLEFATTFGNRSAKPELSPCAFLVDKCYNIYFSGWGSSIGVGNEGTTAGLEVSSNAFQKTTDDNDFYLIVLGRDAKSLLYATYFGGDSSEDHVDGGTSRFDRRGVVYQSVCSSCPDQPPGLNDFPTTPGSAFPVNVSYRCSNASFKFDFNITYAVEANFIASPQKVCIPDTVFFVQSSTFGRKFLWKFGDGDTSNLPNPYHIYKSPGTYLVTLIVIDSGSCNVTDTHSLVIQVMSGPELNLKAVVDACSSHVEFTLSGQDFGVPEWNLGDGSKATGTKVVHNYFPGNYKVKVVAVNPATGCKDSIIKPLIINKDSTQEIFLANVFTPNEDNKNDCFRIYGLSKQCDEAELRIFNRWGERLFYTDDLSECWNGMVNNFGPLLPEGTYFYQILIKKRNGKKENRIISGAINLIR